MRFITYRRNADVGLAARRGSDLVDLPGLELGALLRAGQEGLSRASTVLRQGPLLDESKIVYLPPLVAPPKIICIGLNYRDHVKEGKRQPPTYPTYFARFTRSLIAHGQPLIRPLVSDKLDYEGELAAVIGKGGRYISRERALDHVAGYSVFNDGSVRDYQRRGDQWTLGKNFDGTGAFGPEFVTADELPRGAQGLRLETRLNGVTVQSATINDMIFDISTLIAILSEATTLEPGDVIVTGTPGGVGYARDPARFLKEGDVCEVEVEGVGVLRNPVQNEVAPANLESTPSSLSALPR